MENLRNFHQSALVIDGHGGSGITENYLQRLKEGGVNTLSFAVGWMKEAIPTLRDIEYMRSWIQSHSEDVQLVETAKDLQKAKDENRIGIIFELENVAPLQGDYQLLDTFYQLGIRMVQISYNERNEFADGCTERSDAGLSDKGVHLIEKANDLGILISLSHTGEKSSLDACSITKTPIVFSHSNAREICNNPRNITAEMAESVAETGGVAGVAAVSRFLSENPESASLEDLLDHIDYFVDLLGINHVGLGLDMSDGLQHFNKVTKLYDTSNWEDEKYNQIFKENAFGEEGLELSLPPGLESVEKLPNLTKGLRERGYSVEEVRKIVGGNFYRVYQEVW